MRHSIRRLVMAALATVFVATAVVALVMACDGKGSADAESSTNGK